MSAITHPTLFPHNFNHSAEGRATHPTLFPHNFNHSAEGRAKRGQGVRAVELATWRDDKEQLDRIILRFADGRRPFSSDDVWPYLPAGIRGNAVGAAFLRAAKAGYIVEVGTKHSERPEAHSRKVTVWRGSHGDAA